MTSHLEPDPPLTELEIDQWLQSLGNSDEVRLAIVEDLLVPHNGKKRDPMLKSDRLICERIITLLKSRLDAKIIDGEVIGVQAAVELSNQSESECDQDETDYSEDEQSDEGDGILVGSGSPEVAAEDDYPYNSRDIE